MRVVVVVDGYPRDTVLWTHVIHIGLPTLAIPEGQFPGYILIVVGLQRKILFEVGSPHPNPVSSIGRKIWLSYLHHLVEIDNEGRNPHRTNYDMWLRCVYLKGNLNYASSYLL